MTYETVIIFSWLTFLLFWGVSAFSVKRDVSGGVSSLWNNYWLIRVGIMLAVIIVSVRISTGTAHYTNTKALFANTFFTLSPFMGWFAAFLSVIGIGFAIWARIHLGTNWSARPAIKEGHELVTSGPYRWVRHPIYTGVMCAALGSALTGSVFGLAVFGIITLMFLLRIHTEEKIMLELFPAEYPSYQARTKRLIPFIW